MRKILLIKNESEMERQYKIKPLVVSKYNLRKGDMANRLFIFCLTEY